MHSMRLTVGYLYYIVEARLAMHLLYAIWKLLSPSIQSIMLFRLVVHGEYGHSLTTCKPNDAEEKKVKPKLC